MIEILFASIFPAIFILVKFIFKIIEETIYENRNGITQISFKEMGPLYCIVFFISCFFGGYFALKLPNYNIISLEMQKIKNSIVILFILTIILACIYIYKVKKIKSRESKIICKSHIFWILYVTSILILIFNGFLIGSSLVRNLMFINYKSEAYVVQELNKSINEEISDVIYLGLKESENNEIKSDIVKKIERIIIEDLKGNLVELFKNKFISIFELISMFLFFFTLSIFISGEILYFSVLYNLKQFKIFIDIEGIKQLNDKLKIIIREETTVETEKKELFESYVIGTILNENENELNVKIEFEDRNYIIDINKDHIYMMLEYK